MIHLKMNCYKEKWLIYIEENKIVCMYFNNNVKVIILFDKNKFIKYIFYVYNLTLFKFCKYKTII